MAGGMPRRWWLAARWKWCLDADVVKELFSIMIGEALQLAQDEHWHSPGKLIPGFCELALAELAWPGSFKDPEQRRLWLGLSKGTWSRRRRMYEPVFRMVDDWCSRAYGYLYLAQRSQSLNMRVL